MCPGALFSKHCAEQIPMLPDAFAQPNPVLDPLTTRAHIPTTKIASVGQDQVLPDEHLSEGETKEQRSFWFLNIY